MSVEAPREQAVEPDPERRVDAGDAPGAVLARDLDIARGDERGVANVDQAVVEDVGAQQHLFGTALELGQVQLRRGRPRGSPLEPLHALDSDEHLAPGDPCHEPDHRRVTAGLIEPRDDVFDATETFARRIQQRGACNRR